VKAATANVPQNSFFAALGRASGHRDGCAAEHENHALRQIVAGTRPAVHRMRSSHQARNSNICSRCSRRSIFCISLRFSSGKLFDFAFKLMPLIGIAAAGAQTNPSPLPRQALTQLRQLARGREAPQSPPAIPRNPRG